MDVETKFFGPSKINSDPQQLKQVFWNIFLNACEAIPVGGFIRVSTEKSGRYNEKGEFVDQVIIKVQDNGPGIDPQVIDDIFKPFSTAKKDGSGLGLAIVKRIIEGFGGEISCRNLEDGGAAIAIILPLNVEPA
jgi:signal transduction histidine kinase